jgi:uncharacterized protein YkwD
MLFNVPDFRRISCHLIIVCGALGTGSCVIEGGGCSGPFCFSVATDLCDNGDLCRDTDSDFCPDADDIQSAALSYLNSLRSTPTNCAAVTAPAAAPLQWSQAEFVAADRHAIDMASNNFVAQTGSDGLGVSSRLNPADGTAVATTVGQAVAGGFANTRALLSAWTQQQTECSLMTEAAFTRVGLACRYDNDSDFGQYWTLVLSGN